MMRVSIYSNGPHVWLTMHDGGKSEAHSRLTPAKAREVAATLLNAAAMADLTSVGRG